jgi:hypothetical protein
VQTLRRQLGLGTTHRPGQAREPLGPDECWDRELAQRLGVFRNSLIYWMEHGLVRARKETGGWHRWIVWADAAELERLRAYRDATSPPNIAGAGQPRILESTARKDRHCDRHKSSKRW